MDSYGVGLEGWRVWGGSCRAAAAGARPGRLRMSSPKDVSREPQVQGANVPSLGVSDARQLAELGVQAMPALVQRAGAEGWRAFLNYFAASIENANTRKAYLRASVRLPR